MVGLSRLMEPNLPFLITGSPTAIRILTNNKKTCTDSLPLKKTCIFNHKKKLNDSINMDKTIAGSMNACMDFCCVW